MSMGSHDKSNRKKHRFIRSFYYAISGIIVAVKAERNLKIHLTLSGVVIIFGFSLSITLMEWLVVLIMVGGMLAAEMMNSAIERVVDLVTEDYHPLAKQAKDIAAGAVLFFAITSVLIGVLIFGPRLINLFVL